MARNPNQYPYNFNTDDGISQFYPEFCAPGDEQQQPASSAGRRGGNVRRTARTVNPKWSEKADICLVSGMISVGTDARIGTSQRQSNFWVRVLHFWNQYRVENPQLPERIPDQLRCRWNRMRPKINRWVAAYNEASRRIRSGMSGDDLTVLAHSFYKRDSNGNDFDCMHVWNILRTFDKWSVLPGMNPQQTEASETRQRESSSQGSKRSRDEGPQSEPDDDVYVPMSETPTSAPMESPSPFSAPMEDSAPTPPMDSPAYVAETPRPQPRPQGKKAAKQAKGKHVGSSSGSTEFSQFTQEVKELSINQAEMTELARKRVELAERRLQSENERIRLEAEMKQREFEEARLKRKHDMLMVLLGKPSLSSADEAMKQKLYNDLYGD